MEELAIEEISQKKRADRWAEAWEAMQSPVHSSQPSCIQSAMNVIKAEAAVVNRNLQATLKAHQKEAERWQKIFENRAWQER